MPHLYRIDNRSQYQLSLDNFAVPFKNFTGTPHNQHSLEIGLIKSGNGIFLVEENQYEIQKDDIFVINNIEKHCILSSFPPEHMTYMVIFFEPSFVYFSENNIFDYRFLKIFYDRPIDFQNRLPRDNPLTEEVRKLLLDIEKEFSDALEGYELVIKVKLLNILAILLRYYDYKYLDGTQNLYRKSNFDSLSRILSYINEHYMENITLESLAKIANMNSSYLSSIFTKFNGYSLWSFICKVRVTKASEYLKSTNKSISEIAGLCGFNNLSNFNRIFKNISEHSPSEYRRKNVNKQ